jgi:hypothetical protein
LQLQDKHPENRRFFRIPNHFPFFKITIEIRNWLVSSWVLKGRLSTSQYFLSVRNLYMSGESPE